MTNHVTLDFSLAKLHHQLWRMKLRLFLDDQEKLTLAEAVSHTECELGKWIYSTGQAEYGTESEMVNLERVHAHLHREIREVVSLKNSGKTDEAEAEYQKIVPLSIEVLDFLEKMNQKVNHG